MIFATPPIDVKGSVKEGNVPYLKLFQINCTFCLDEMLPKGTVLVECGKMLEKGGYVIKSLNTINFKKSMHYNRATCSPPKMRRTALFSFSSVN